MNQCTESENTAEADVLRREDEDVAGAANMGISVRIKGWNYGKEASRLPKFSGSI